MMISYTNEINNQKHYLDNRVCTKVSVEGYECMLLDMKNDDVFIFLIDGQFLAIVPAVLCKVTLGRKLLAVQTIIRLVHQVPG